MFLPADVGNQALDAAGIDFTIGDLEEGTRAAQVLLRAYPNCLRQLLRAAHWDFARKQLPLVMLGDVSGQTPNTSALVPIPWLFEYQYPNDCMKLQWIPWNFPQFPTSTPPGNISLPQTPLTTAPITSPLVGQRLRPARFLIGTDPNYPSAPGTDFSQTQGQSPAGSTVIMTNVQGAVGIYTSFMPYPNTWDSLFRASFVAYLASEVSLPLAKDKKLGLEIQKNQIGIAKAKIGEARVANGNEGFFSSDIRVDWMETRRGRGWGGPNWGWGWDDGPGSFWGSWDACGFADGSAY